MRKYLFFLSVFVLMLLARGTQSSPVRASATIPPPPRPAHQLITDTVSAQTPQLAVEIVIAAFNAASEQDRQNFDGGAPVVIPAGEDWVIATNWYEPVPNAANPLKVEGGYGVWWIRGPWSGYTDSGVGVKLNFEKMSTIFLPLISNEKSMPSYPLVTAVLSAESPQAAVQAVIAAFSAAQEQDRQNFAGGASFEAQEGEIWVIATDWGATVPTIAIPLKTEGGYGVWLVDGPWSGTIPSGVGVRQ